MRGLPPEYVESYVAKRDQVEAIVIDVISEGQREGIFDIPDLKVVTGAILTMLVGIADWYKPNGRLSIQQLIQIYTHSVMKLLAPSDGPKLPGPPSRSVKRQRG